MGLVVWRFSRSQVVPKRKIGILLLILSTLYFTAMLFRLLVGLVDLSDAVWFHRPISSFFHFVLATSILLIGHFHFTWTDQREGHK